MGLLCFGINTYSIVKFGGTNILRLLVGLLLILNSICLFIVVIRGFKNRFEFGNTDNKPRFFYESGPYKYIRHPIYAAYILNWMSAAIICNSAPPLISFIIMVCIYIKFAKKEERLFKQSSFSAK